jgi:hypothetical protein
VALWGYTVAGAADALRCAAGTPPGRLTAVAHAAAPSAWALASFIALAFYGIIWPDETFWRNSVVPRLASGIPFLRYMHELHALPMLVPLVELVGGRDATVLAAHLPSGIAATAHTFSFGGAWVAFMLVNAYITGAVPYPVLVRLTPPQLTVFVIICFATLAALTAAARVAITWRAAGGAPRAKKLR